VPPRRIQLRRTKGWRKPEGAVVVARPSRWGNPYRVGPDRTAEEAVASYRDHVTDRVDEIRAELAGRDLCCWCPLDRPCHADVLLELANGPPTERS
jgi:hypothetical protein